MGCSLGTLASLEEYWPGCVSEMTGAASLPAPED